LLESPSTDELCSEPEIYGILFINPLEECENGLESGELDSKESSGISG
jgi:hypothetical protein